MGVIQHTAVFTTAIDRAFDEGVITNRHMCLVDKSLRLNKHNVIVQIIKIVFNVAYRYTSGFMFIIIS